MARPGLTLDTGALVALERRDRRAGLFLAQARNFGAKVTVPAPVVVEWWRGQRGPLARVLDDMQVESLDRELAEIAGVALAEVDGASVVDAVVMASAARRGDVVLTGDVDDLGRLQLYFPTVRILTI